MGHKEESRRTMEETPTHEEANITNEKNTTFYLYHPCSLLQKFLGTLFKCLGFEIETNTKEHNDGVKSPSNIEEDVGTKDNKAGNEHEGSQNVLACAEQKESSTSSTTQSFQFIRTLIIRRGGPRRSGPSSGSGPGIN